VGAIRSKGGRVRYSHLSDIEDAVLEVVLQFVELTVISSPGAIREPLCPQLKGCHRRSSVDAQHLPGHLMHHPPSPGGGLGASGTINIGAFSACLQRFVILLVSLEKRARVRQNSQNLNSEKQEEGGTEG